jgi:hypothetical protein
VVVAVRPAAEVRRRGSAAGRARLDPRWAVARKRQVWKGSGENRMNGGRVARYVAASRDRERGSGGGGWLARKKRWRLWVGLDLKATAPI